MTPHGRRVTRPRARLVQHDRRLKGCEPNCRPPVCRRLAAGSTVLFLPPSDHIALAGRENLLHFCGTPVAVRCDQPRSDWEQNRRTSSAATAQQPHAAVETRQLKESATLCQSPQHLQLGVRDPSETDSVRDKEGPPGIDVGGFRGRWSGGVRGVGRVRWVRG